MIDRAIPGGQCELLQCWREDAVDRLLKMTTQREGDEMRREVLERMIELPVYGEVSDALREMADWLLKACCYDGEVCDVIR